MERKVVPGYQYIYEDDKGEYWFGTPYEDLVGPFKCLRKAVDAFYKFCLQLDAEREEE